MMEVKTDGDANQKSDMHGCIGDSSSEIPRVDMDESPVSCIDEGEPEGLMLPLMRSGEGHVLCNGIIVHVFFGRRFWPIQKRT
jgi:hypothetical protein